ncbi:hypothetical protein GCWU000324_01111 [Kingella oralis ATCC 51147]|uniref:Uncharacterized protein n=1 Tax=Kingella oralis ATCC 51147 TaxID=629741 RepID=C4GG44_9NEIS|nr:hypothetical protein GCWU000324_01111 [Kingella oralis ATCC 51147]
MEQRCITFSSCLGCHRGSLKIHQARLYSFSGCLCLQGWLG